MRLCVFALTIILDPFDLSAHFSGQHIPKHFVIRNERPKRIFESCRPILFNDKMREPRKSITANKTQRKVIPSAAHDEPDNQYQPKRRADKMQPTRQRLAVFRNIKIPKFCVCLDHEIRNYNAAGLDSAIKTGTGGGIFILVAQPIFLKIVIMIQFISSWFHFKPCRADVGNA